MDLEADMAAVEPLAKDVAAVRAAAADRDDLYELERVISRIDRRLLAVEESRAAPPAAMGDERVDELEDAVVAVLRQVTQLREEFNLLVDALGS